MKFSIIVLVYNVEKYLNKCLDSVLNQTYDNFECIIVYDDSKDKSSEIVEEYVKKDKRFKKTYKKNTGLSIAKNIGVSKASGDYILFLDGDDYFEPSLLKMLNDNLNELPDMIRFQAREVYSDKAIDYNENGFNTMDGLSAFKKIVKYHFVENSWLYCYKRKFWNKYNFKFMDNCIAEDYGLTPLIISKSKSILSLSYIGYNYVQRPNSLMNNNNNQKKIKKMDDMIKQAKYLKQNIKDSSINTFINNSLMTQVIKLKYADYKKYINDLKSMNIFEYYSKMGKILIKVNPYYIRKYFGRFL